MKVLALDFGEAKIGLAIGESQIGVASPRDFLVNDQKTLEKLSEFCHKEKIEKIILGLPRGFRGETDQTQSVRDFAKKIACTGIPIKFIDESFTSQLAIKNLQNNQIKARQQKNLIDSEAARIILQDYFDSNSAL